MRTCRKPDFAGGREGHLNYVSGMSVPRGSGSTFRLHL
jgi:hypothetical protein